MRVLILSIAVTCITGGPQIAFGPRKPATTTTTPTTPSTTTKPVNTRLGLLAGQLGLDPVAGSNSGNSGNFGASQAFTSGQSQSQNEFQSEATGRLSQQCCCVSVQEQCGDLFGTDFVGLGLIDPRLKNTTSSRANTNTISTRIVNRPVASTNAQPSAQPLNTCPVGQKTCCYDSSIDLSVFGINCISPSAALKNVPWTQGCSENVRSSSKLCGTRQPTFASGLQHGQSLPGEFPWTCLLLNQNNDFVGSCAVIPDDFNNDNGRPTRKVITAAHKLKDVQRNDLLKVRVGEWDASGFNSPEQVNHQEYTVVRILKHPEFNAGRLDNDIAILYTERNIEINSSPYVNTACLPSCDNQFDFLFSNGTGVRCHVAGWGKDEVDGQFQFIPKKVDLSLIPAAQCEAKLKVALNARKPGVGDRFQLDSSEICAGGEVGKDACTGDGGSPLVCQAQSGRWTVVGLVTWGVGCASETPGVYVRISHFRNWINAN